MKVYNLKTGDTMLDSDGNVYTIVGWDGGWCRVTAPHLDGVKVLPAYTVLEPVDASWTFKT